MLTIAPSTQSSTFVTVPLLSVASLKTENPGLTLAPFFGEVMFTVGGVPGPAPNRLMIALCEFCMPPQSHGWSCWFEPVHVVWSGAIPLTQSLPHWAATFWKYFRVGELKYVIGSL